MPDSIIGRISVGDGATFTPSVNSAGEISWTNNKNLPNPETVDLAQAVLDRGTFLPLSGGTITGNITSSVADAKYLKANDSGANNFFGGTNWNKGGFVSIYGKDSTNALAGGFRIGSHDGSNGKFLDGKPDGTLTWAGSNILTAANYNSYSLPLSGGTMTGVICTSNSVAMYGTSDTSYLGIYGNNGGAGIAIHGTNHATKAGWVQFDAKDSSQTKRFIAAPDGTLTWGGQPLLPVGIVQAFAGTTIPNGWLLCDGSAVSRTQYSGLFGVIGTTYGAGDGSTTFNLPNLVNKFVEGSATSGTVKSAGLPNITGSFNSDANGTGWILFGNTQGSFKVTGGQPNNALKATQTGEAQGTRRTTVSLDASLSSAIYGNSTTVQPPAVTMRYIIKY